MFLAFLAQNHALVTQQAALSLLAVDMLGLGVKYAARQLARNTQ